MTNGVQGFFRGMGKMYTTMAGTFLQSSIRTICTIIFAPVMGMTGIAFSCAIGWIGMLLFEVSYYFYTNCPGRVLHRWISEQGQLEKAILTNRKKYTGLSTMSIG